MASHVAKANLTFFLNIQKNEFYLSFSEGGGYLELSLFECDKKGNPFLTASVNM